MKSKKSLENKLKANRESKGYKDSEERTEKESKGISGKYSSSGGEEDNPS